VDYRPGGYHPAYMGEIFNTTHVLLEKIGWGHFSTVWLCKNIHSEAIYAMKIQKSAEHYYEAAFDEIKILSQVKTHKFDPEFLELRAKHDPKAEPEET